MTADVNAQLQSPLFGVIPPEIRNYIFELALTPYDDPKHEYPADSFYYRPYLRARPYTSTTLLQTCCRIYSETSTLPLRLATFYYWYQPERGPRGYRGEREHHMKHMKHLSQLTSSNLRALTNAHFFVQLAELRDRNINRLMSRPRFLFRIITFTIRYTDWWWWEYDHDLKMENQDVVQSLLFPATCEEFVMELETTEKKRAQLESIVDGMQDWVFRAGNEGQVEGQRRLVRKGAPVVSGWEGSACFEGKRYETPHGQADRLKYFVMTLKWVREEGHPDPTSV